MIARPSKATAKASALAVARAMLDKKALDVQVLHVAPLTSIADYLVIGSAESDRQTRAIADSVAEALSCVGQRPLSLEGTTSGQWVLIDFGDVVAHVFRHDTRSHYALERLWRDAQSIPIPDNASPSAATPKRYVIQKTTSRKMV
ncbi:MAG: Ribosomal silencing factor RsfS [Nitrospira sp.]